MTGHVRRSMGHGGHWIALTTATIVAAFGCGISPNDAGQTPGANPQQQGIALPSEVSAASPPPTEGSSTPQSLPVGARLLYVEGVPTN